MGNKADLVEKRVVGAQMAEVDYGCKDGVEVDY